MGDAENHEPKSKQAHGGEVRATKLTPERCKEIAKLEVAVTKHQPPGVPAVGPERRPCYVLSARAFSGCRALIISNITHDIE